MTLDERRALVKKMVGEAIDDLVRDAVATEREACAKVADQHDSYEHGDCNAACFAKIAEKIRARTAETPAAFAHRHGLEACEPYLT